MDQGKVCQGVPRMVTPDSLLIIDLVIGQGSVQFPTSYLHQLS